MGSLVTALTFEQQIRVIIDWASHRLSKVTFVANVHMLMEAYWNQGFQGFLNQADLVTPDGMPLVWMMRCLGFPQQDRVAGMDIFLALCDQASKRGISVCLVGSTSEILATIRSRLSQDFPSLIIACAEPLPFRPLTEAEDEELVARINSSGAGIVFVALGCPKQEYWMSNHKDRIDAVMVGVGAVFAVYSGVQKWAPKWCREAGLEWLYRLIQEPRRLWKRYGTTIPPFIWLSIKQLITESKARKQLFLKFKP